MLKKNTLTETKYDWFASVLVLLYLVLAELSRHFPIAFVRYSGRAFMYLSVFYDIFAGGRYRIPKKMVFCAALCLVTGVLNCFIVGNQDMSSLLYMLLCLLFAHMLLFRSIHPSVFLAAFYFYAALVLFLFLRDGLYTQVYANSSNNFISVYLSFPIILYYITADRQGAPLRAIPAICYWIMTLLGRGRGGIVCGSVFLLIILLSAIFSGRKSTGRVNKFLAAMAVLSAIILIAATIAYGKLSTWEPFRKFAKLGMSNNGRSAVWNEYLYSLSGNPSNIIFGSSFADMSVVIMYLENLHNSFLNIHAFNGIVMLGYLLGMLIWDTVLGFRHKRFVFIACLLLLSMRGFTDFVFWGGVPGTLIFFTLLFNPLLFELEPRPERRRRNTQSYEQ